MAFEQEFDLGLVTAYAHAVSKGYTGTEEEFAELMASYATVAEDAAASAAAAAASATDAAGSASTATTKANAASASANDAAASASAASTKAGEASESASSAASNASVASGKAGEAAASATAAAGSATTAGSKASEASESATNAATAKTAAQAAQTAAETAQGKAEDAQEAAEAAAEAAEETLNSYAKVDGSYSSMTVGNAEQLVATVGVEDSVPYNFRTSGGAADIGDRAMDRIVGGTLVWNQMVDGAATSVALASGHRYVARIGDTWAILTGAGSAIPVTGGADVAFDLTRMFGAAIADYVYGLEQANAGAGVTWFRKLFPKPYYAYNPGELMSVQAAAHVMRGFNAWDEEWETGQYNPTTGEPSTQSNAIRSKNLIPVLPNTTYYLKFPADASARIFYCGSNGEMLSTISQSPNQTFTTPADAHYMKFHTNAGYGGTYHNDICINLSWDGERDGEYEPYQEWNYSLDDSLTLRGIPRLDADNRLYYDGDTYESDGTVTRRYNAVTFDGSDDENWRQYGGSRFQSFTDIPDFTSPASSVAENLFTNRGFKVLRKSAVPTTNDGSRYISAGDSGTHRLLVNLALDTLEEVKAWLAANPLTVLYPVNAPTTETADPFQSPQWVDDFGTEEYVDAAVAAETRDVAVPVGHDTLYQANLRAKLEMSPDSPDGDGDYIVRQANGQNEYVPLVIPQELPANPTTDGTYHLKATVSGGSVTLTWEADT